MSNRFSRSKLALAGACILAPAIALALGGRPAEDEDAVNARIQPVAKVKLAPLAAAGTAAASRSGEEIYNAACMACHIAGVADAPKTGDQAAWAPRIAAGLGAMLQVVLDGKGAMPPRGGSDATDEELKRAIVHMANQSGGSFAE